jgi:hypothetical protein
MKKAFFYGVLFCFLALFSNCAINPITDLANGNSKGDGVSQLAITLPEANSGKMVAQFTSLSNALNNRSFTVNFSGKKIIEAGFTLPADSYNITVSVLDTGNVLKYYGQSGEAVIVRQNGTSVVNINLVYVENGRVILRNKILYVLYGEVYLEEGIPAGSNVAVTAMFSNNTLDSSVTIEDGTFYLLIDSSYLNKTIKVKAETESLFGESELTLGKTNNYALIVLSAVLIAYVSPFGSHIYPYNTWAKAATNIQTAIDVVSTGGTVIVTNGVYNTGGVVAVGQLTNRIAILKPIIVKSVNGPEGTLIVGQLDPNSSNPTNGAPGPQGYVNGHGDAAVRCVFISNGGVLTGFTLTNGYTRTSNGMDMNGGGIWCASMGTIVSNCVVSGNNAYNYAGGIYCGNGTTVVNCRIKGNTAGIGSQPSYTAGKGGGLYCENNCLITGNIIENNCSFSAFGSAGGGGIYSRGTIKNCSIINNSANGYASGFGGGLYLEDGSVLNCIVMSNRSGAYAGQIGGGIYSGSSISIKNCLIVGNYACPGYGVGSGGGIAGGILENCTIVGNIAGNGVTIDYGGGHIETHPGLGGGAYGSILSNCILYSNQAAVGTNYYSCSLAYSCTMPLAPGVGNITNDPQFVNFASGNFRLQNTSPCRNTGLNLDWMNTAKDLDGSSRIMGGIVDRGAFEVIE